MKFINHFLVKNFPVILFFTAFLLLAYQIDKPFFGNHDFNNSYFGNIARNYLRYGLVTTKLGQVTNSEYVTSGHFTYHTHHPPLLPLFLALSYWLFGVNEVTTRLVPIVFSSLTLSVFYLLVKSKFGSLTAALACICWLISPLFLYYGKMAIHEVLVLFFFVLAFWQYSKTNFRLMVIAMILGMLSGWPGYYIPAIIGLIDIVYFRRIKKEFLIIYIICVSLFLGYLVNNFILTGSLFGGGFLDAFLIRSQGVELADYFKREVQMSLIYFNKPVCLIALVGLGISIFKREFLIGLFFLFGLAHLLFFKEAAYRHDYLIYYLLPFVTLSAAYGVVSFGKNRLILIGCFGLMVIFSLVQGRLYLSTLLAGSRYRDSVKIGKFVRNISKPSDTVLVVMPIDTKEEIEGWHITFYANRNLSIIRDDNFQLSTNSIYDRIIYYDTNGTLKIIK